MINIGDILVIILILIIIYKMKFFKGINTEYIDLEQSVLLKGVLAIFVMICHTHSISTYGSSIFFRIFGQPFLAVGMFIFLSGYGVMTQYLTKGNGYLKSFLSKRIKTILIPLFLVSIIYMIVHMMFLHDGTTVLSVLLSYLKGDPIVTYSWFLIEIFIFYIVFYLGCKIEIFTNGKIKIEIIVFILGGILFTVLLQIANFKEALSPCICFILGILWAKYKNKIDLIISKKYYLYFVITIIGFLAATVIRYVLPKEASDIINSQTSMSRLVFIEIQKVIFCILILLILKKVKINNIFIKYFSIIYYEIFLLQGLSILIISRLKIDFSAWNMLSQFSVIFITILLAKIQYLIDKKVISYLNKK